MPYSSQDDDAIEKLRVITRFCNKSALLLNQHSGYSLHWQLIGSSTSSPLAKLLSASSLNPVRSNKDNRSLVEIVKALRYVCIERCVPPIIHSEDIVYLPFDEHGFIIPLEPSLLSLFPHRFSLSYLVYDGDISRDSLLTHTHEYIVEGSSIFLSHQYRINRFTIPRFGDLASIENSIASESSYSSIFCELPPVVCVKLYYLYAAHSGLYALTQNLDCAAIIYEYNRSCDRPVTGLALDSLPSQVFISSETIQMSDSLYIQCIGNANYGHWLVDDLTRICLFIIYALRDRIIRGDNLTILLRSSGSLDLDKAKRDSIDWLLKSIARELSVGDPIILDSNIFVSFLKEGESACVKDAYVVSPASFHPVMSNGPAIRLIRSLSQPFSSHHPTRKLFLCRRKTRRFINQDCLLDLLESRGFEKVYCEELTFLEQIHLFSHSSDVIGAMGAEICNVIFSPPSTNITMLAPSGWIEPFYDRLIGELGLKAKIVYCDTHPSESSKAPHLRDLSIDVEMLSRILDENAN